MAVRSGPFHLLNINSLLSDELTYELLIRGVAAATKKVDEKRRELRALFLEERLGTSNVDTFDFSTLDIESEVEIGQNKLLELKRKYIELEGHFQEPGYIKLLARLTHYSLRFLNLKSFQNEDVLGLIESFENLIKLTLDLQRRQSGSLIA